MILLDYNCTYDLIKAEDYLQLFIEIKLKFLRFQLSISGYAIFLLDFSQLPPNGQSMKLKSLSRQHITSLTY